MSMLTAIQWLYHLETGRSKVCVTSNWPQLDKVASSRQLGAEQWCGDHTMQCKHWICPALARCLNNFAMNLMHRLCCYNHQATWRILTSGNLQKNVIYRTAKQLSFRICRKLVLQEISYISYIKVLYLFIVNLALHILLNGTMLYNKVHHAMT